MCIQSELSPSKAEPQIFGSSRLESTAPGAIDIEHLANPTHPEEKASETVWQRWLESSTESEFQIVPNLHRRHLFWHRSGSRACSRARLQFLLDVNTNAGPR